MSEENNSELEIDVQPVNFINKGDESKITECSFDSECGVVPHVTASEESPCSTELENMSNVPGGLNFKNMEHGELGSGAPKMHSEEFEKPLLETSEIDDKEEDISGEEESLSDENEDGPLTKIIAAPLPNEEDADLSLMGRKRKRNKKYDSVNYEDTHIEGVDSDMDVDVLRDSDSEEEEVKPKRPSRTRRTKVEDFQERQTYSQNGQNSQMMRSVTTRMEPGGDSNYTLTDGVPDWVDYDVGYEECGSRILETVYARRKIDRSLPNNGIVVKSGHLSTQGVSLSPMKSKSGSILSKTADDDDDDDEEEHDNDDDVQVTENVFDSRYEYEYQCKFKGRSHLHLEWVSCEDLEGLSHKAKQHFYRYLKKIQLEKDEGEDEVEPYMEIWEVDHLLAHRTFEEEIPDMSQMPTSAEAVEVGSSPVSHQPDDEPVLNEQVKQEKSLSEKATFSIGDLVDVARHDRNGKTCFGGVGLIIMVHSPDEEQGCFTFDVRYVVGGGGVTKVEESMLSLQDDGTSSSPRVSPNLDGIKNSSTSRTKRKNNPKNEDDTINKNLTLIDRCRFLLERFENDALCEPFLVPVDVRAFPDYEEVVDHPMDLGTIRRKLDTGGTKGYREDSAFIRDMRLVWTNCKKYNHRDAPIWHTADSLQKACERLFQAWVVAFAPPDENGDPVMQSARSKRLSLANQKFDYKRCKNKKRRGAAARPWEQSCRCCEDPTESDEPVLLCDHCDAQYHLGCTTSPKLTKLPEYAWLCPVCVNEPHKNRSAIAEDAAMKKMDIASLPKLVVSKQEFLVKWVGKGYAHCSWESAEDIDDRKMIDNFMNQSGGEVLTSKNVLSDEPLIPYSRMIKEFHDGFERAIGIKVFRDPFRVPTLKAAEVIPYHKHVGKIPMPLLDPSWVVRHDPPPPPFGSPAAAILGQYVSREDENPMRDVMSAVYAQIRLAHYLNHMPPVAAVVKASAQIELNEEKEKQEKEKNDEINKNKMDDSKDKGIKQDEIDNVDVVGQKECHLELPREFLLASGTVTSGLAFLARRREEATKAGLPLPIETIVETSVADLLGELVEHVVRGNKPKPPGPPLRIGEYDICIPKLASGFHLNIHDDDGAVKVASFRSLPNNSFPPAAVAGVLPGDTLVRINGQSISATSFAGICGILGGLELGMVYLRFLRNCVDAEIRPEMLVVHRARPDITTPGEASSKYRGVFRRDDEWEVAICLHPTINSRIEPSPYPPSLYLVMASYEDEEIAAEQYDSHAASLSSNMAMFLWPHLGGRRMNAFELQLYYPRRPIRYNFGPMGYYQGFKEDAWNAGIKGSRPQKTVKVKHGDDSDYDDALSFDDEEESISSESEDDEDDDEEIGQPKKNDEPEVYYSLAECGLKFEEPPSMKQVETEKGNSNSENGSARDKLEEVDNMVVDDEKSGDEEEEVEDKMNLVNPLEEALALSPSKSVEDGSAAKALSKLSKKLVVRESTWLEAGQMEKLLLATHRSSQPPVDDDWFSTGLPAPPLKKEMEKLTEEVKSENEATTALAAGETKVARQVVQRDPDTGKVLRIWPSSTAAAKHFSVPFAKMQEACKANAEFCGFIWESFGQFGDTAAVDEETIQKRREDGVFQYAESREYKGGNKLRDYQLNGLNWLLLCHHYKRSCILADEMGLGKTVQVVSFLEHLVTVDKLRGPFLVVVPLSTVGHWEREFKGWTDMQVCVYHDNGKDIRALIRAFEWYFDGRAPSPPGTGRVKFEVLITTYDEVIKDMDHLASIPWRGLIVDEAHRLKGISSKLLECLHQIMPLGVQRHGSQHRLLMTGTPLQNNTMELWSLLNFIEPSKFPSLENFQETYEGMDSEYQVRSLQQRLAPHLLRRVKEDVATDIPAKFETVIDVELTTLQKQYYRAIFEKNQAFLARAAKGSVVPKLMNIQMELRKCCNHPYLIDGVEEREAEILNEKLGSENNGVVSDASFKKAWLERCLLQSSGKLVLLDKLLPKLRREGHKVLIFSQMTRVLNILEDFCGHRSFNCERLDGSVTGSMRQAAIDRFNDNENSFVFLLSTRAGGVGINLCAADTCIIFDSDWNPQNDVQAQARCHRIGQTKEVMVYRLITRKSFEAEMFDRASVKLGLERAVLGTRDFDGDYEGDENDGQMGGGGGGGGGDIKLSQNEMEKLLRQGAYALMEDDTEGDAVAAAFCEGDIDSILEERSRVRKIESGQTAGWLSKNNSKLSGLQNRVTKSSFTAQGAADNKDVAVDDPNFWAKVLPDMKNAALLKDQLSGLLAMDEKDPQEVARIVKDVKDVTVEVMERVSKGKKLAEIERKDLQDLLFRLSLCGDLIGEENRAYAESMHLVLEGKRRRTTATTFGQSPSEDNGTNSLSSRQAALKAAQESKKLVKLAKATSTITNRNFKKNDDYEAEGSDDDEDDDDEEDDDDDDDIMDEEDLIDDTLLVEEGDEKNQKIKKKKKKLKKSVGKPTTKSPKQSAASKPSSNKPSKLTKSLSKAEDGIVDVGPVNKPLKRKSSKKSVYIESGSEGTDEDDLLPAYGASPTEPQKPKKGKPKKKPPLTAQSTPKIDESTPIARCKGVDDADFFELECGKCGEWFVSKEVGVTRAMAEHFTEWICPGCDDDTKPSVPGDGANQLVSEKKVKRKKKQSFKEQEDQGDVDTTNATKRSKTEEGEGSGSPKQSVETHMDYITCEPWPKWKDIPNKKALNIFIVSFVEELFKIEEVEDVFGFPVPEDTPGYSVLIDDPMDLGTIYEKAEKGEYHRLIDFRNDLELVVNNCLTFNADGSDFYKMAQDLATTIPSVYVLLTTA